MKRTAILTLLLVMVSSLAVSQVIAVEDSPVFIISGGPSVKLTATTAGPTAYTKDSVAAANYQSIIYTGTKWPNLIGQYPDSIAMFTYGTADSAHDVLFRFKGASRYGAITSTATAALVDSNRSTTAAVSFTRHTISPTFYALYDCYGLSAFTEAPTDAYNPKNKANRSTIYVRVVRYFHR